MCFSRNEDDHVTQLQGGSQSMNTYCTRASSCVDKPGFSQNGCVEYFSQFVLVNIPCSPSNSIPVQEKPFPVYPRLQEQV